MFNLLTLLEVEKLERNHSRILSELLNPRGSHGQGSLFLEHFLSLVGLGHLDAQISPFSHIEVRSELPVTEESRLDIVIRCSRPPFYLIVENKIRSDEGARNSSGKRQVEKYRDWLDQFKDTFKETCLVFLTIHRSKSDSFKDNKPAEHKQLSYLRDITSWLQDCLPDVKAPRVEHTLRQYLQTVEQLRNLKKEDTDGDG